MKEKKGKKLIAAIKEEIKAEKKLKDECTCSEVDCSNYCSDHHDN